MILNKYIVSCRLAAETGVDLYHTNKPDHKMELKFVEHPSSVLPNAKFTAKVTWEYSLDASRNGIGQVFSQIHPLSARAILCTPY